MSFSLKNFGFIQKYNFIQKFYSHSVTFQFVYAGMRGESRYRMISTNKNRKITANVFCIMLRIVRQRAYLLETCKITICQAAIQPKQIQIQYSKGHSNIFAKFRILRFYTSSCSRPVFVLYVCPIVTLHVSFVNSEAAIQRCYIKIGVLEVFESFSGKTQGEVLF